VALCVDEVSVDQLGVAVADVDGDDGARFHGWVGSKVD
jgi:hypothetical protein